MRVGTLLRISIITGWAFAVAEIVSSELLESSLPPPLQEYLASEMERDFTLLDLGLLSFGVLFLITFVVASVGLFLFRRWARSLYLGATVVGYVILGFTGPYVGHALPTVLGEFSVLLSGFILGIAFVGGVFAEPGGGGSQPRVPVSSSSP